MQSNNQPTMTTTTTPKEIRRRLSRAVPNDLLADDKFREVLSDKARTTEVSSSSGGGGEEEVASLEGGVSAATEKRLAEAAASPQRVLSEHDTDLVPHVERRAEAIERRRRQATSSSATSRAGIVVDRNSPHAQVPVASQVSLLPQNVTWQMVAAFAVVLFLVVVCARRWAMVKSLGVMHALAAELPSLASVFALFAGVSVEKMQANIRQHDAGGAAERYTPRSLLPPPPQQQQQPATTTTTPQPATTIPTPAAATPPATSTPPPQQQQQVDQRKETILSLIEEATAYAEDARDDAERVKQEEEAGQNAGEEEEGGQEAQEDEEEVKKPVAAVKRRRAVAAIDEDAMLRHRTVEITRGATTPIAAAVGFAATQKTADTSVAPPVDSSVEQQQHIPPPLATPPLAPPADTPVKMFARKAGGGIPGVKKAVAKTVVDGATIVL